MKKIFFSLIIIFGIFYLIPQVVMAEGCCTGKTTSDPNKSECIIVATGEICQTLNGFYIEGLDCNDPMCAPANESPQDSQQKENCNPPEGNPDSWLAKIGIPGGQIIPIECTFSYSRSCLDNQSIVKKCGLNSFFQIIINFTTLIIGLTGSAMMLMIVYAGTMLILAAGQAERVTKAKDILKASIIGLVIILGAWMFINAIILTLTEGVVGNTSPAAKLFNQNFNQQQNIGNPGWIQSEEVIPSTIDPRTIPQDLGPT